MNCEKFKKSIEKFEKEYNLPAMDLIVYKEHKEIFRYIGGRRNKDSLMTGKELYIIYSMTKMLTCTATLQLFEQGKFLLDDEISKYIPEYNSNVSLLVGI